MAGIFSNEELMQMIQMLKRRFNPGSETTAHLDFRNIDWNAVSVDCGRSAQECRNAFAAYILEISPHRNAHEILSLGEIRLQPGKIFDSHSADTGEENTPMGPAKPSKPKKLVLPDAIVPPLSPLQIFIIKTCERTGEDHASVDKPLWKHKYSQLKDEKKIKYIKLAIRDDIRFQEELADLGDSQMTIPDKFMYLSKKDLELFLHLNGIEKNYSSGYNLYVSEALVGSHNDEDSNAMQKMKEIADTWKNMSTGEKQDYVERFRKQKDQRAQRLRNAPPEIVMVEEFLKTKPTGSATNQATNQKRKGKPEKDDPAVPPKGKTEKDDPSVPPVVVMVDENSVSNFSPIKKSPKKRRQLEFLDETRGDEDGSVSPTL